MSFTFEYFSYWGMDLCCMSWPLPCAAPSHMGASRSLVPGHWWTRAGRTWTQWKTRRRLCWCCPPGKGRWRKASGRWSDQTARRWWTYWWHRPWSGCWWSYLQRHHEGKDLSTLITGDVGCHQPVPSIIYNHKKNKKQQKRVQTDRNFSVSFDFSHFSDFSSRVSFDDGLHPI